MGKPLEPVTTRIIRIGNDYLSQDTVTKYFRPVTNSNGTIELPPATLGLGIIFHFGPENSVIMKLPKDLTMAKLKQQLEHLPKDVLSLLAFAVLQGFNYIEMDLSNPTYIDNMTI